MFCYKEESKFFYKALNQLV